MVAALGVFLEKGYRAVRLEDVAKRAGVTKPLVYHYFKDKDDLLLRALDWKIGQVLLEMRTEIEKQTGGAEAKLRYLFDRSWQRWKNPDWGRFHGHLLIELSQENPELFRKWMEGALVERWELVENILVQGQQDGEVRADLNAQAAARFLISGGMQIAYLHFHTDLGSFAPCPEGDLRSGVLEVFLAGVRPPANKQGADS